MKVQPTLLIFRTVFLHHTLNWNSCYNAFGNFRHIHKCCLTSKNAKYWHILANINNIFDVMMVSSGTPKPWCSFQERLVLQNKAHLLFWNQQTLSWVSNSSCAILKNKSICIQYQICHDNMEHKNGTPEAWCSFQVGHQLGHQYLLIPFWNSKETWMN